ncbi:MAG: two-component system aerobic respiration control sensor histidine kinase ArcB, partial [Psychromonas sp.]
SVGLKRIQGIAQQLQSPDLPAWWDNIDDWVELIKSEFPKDIMALKKWVVANGK